MTIRFQHIHHWNPKWWRRQNHTGDRSIQMTKMSGLRKGSNWFRRIFLVPSTSRKSKAAEMVVNLGLERIEPKHREKKVSLGFMLLLKTCVSKEHMDTLSLQKVQFSRGMALFSIRTSVKYIDNGSQSDHANDPIDAPSLSSKLFLKWARTWRGKQPKAWAHLKSFKGLHTLPTHVAWLAWTKPCTSIESISLCPNSEIFLSFGGPFMTVLQLPQLTPTDFPGLSPSTVPKGNSKRGFPSRQSSLPTISRSKQVMALAPLGSSSSIEAKPLSSLSWDDGAAANPGISLQRCPETQKDIVAHHARHSIQYTRPCCTHLHIQYTCIWYV